MQIELTPRGLMTAFFRQKTKFLMTFLIVVLAGITYVLLATPVYESTGALLVKFGNSARPDIASPERQPTQAEISQTGHEVIESYIGMLQSNNLLMKLITEFGPEKIYPDLLKEQLSGNRLTEAAMKKLKHDLTISAGQETDIIQISLFNPDPKLAADMVYRLQELFIALQTEVYNTSQTDFMSQQVQQAAQQLANDQEKLQAFKAKSGISSIDTEESTLLEEKNSVKTSNLTSGLESVNDAQENLDQLKAKEAQLLTTYKTDAAPVVQLRQSIAVAESQLNERKRAMAAHAGAASSDINRRIAHLESDRSEYNDLARQVQIDSDNYKNYLLRLEEAKINDKMNQENITRVVVLDTPIVAAKPAKPPRLLIVIFSVMAGMVLGFGAVLVSETMDERFSSRDQLSMLLKTPALAISEMKLHTPSTVPLLSDKNHDRNSAERESAGSAMTILSPLLPSGMLMEVFNMIKSALPDKSSRIVQFVSAYNHEGANLIAFDMAAMVAIRTPLRVLFVDTSAEPTGVRRQLAEAVNALPDASARNMHTLGVMPAAVVIGTNLAYTTLNTHDHSMESTFGELQATSTLLDTWRKMYDLVVIPSPAIMAESAHKALAKLADGSVLVVEADRTRAPVVVQMQNMILSNGGHIICAILNKRNFYIPKWLYRMLWL